MPVFRKTRLPFILLLAALLLLAGCQDEATQQQAFVQADASKTNVTVQVAGSSQPLQPPNSAQLQAGDGVQVDATGRALLRFSDFLTVEVLRTGDLQVQELDIAEQSALAVFGQSGGAFVNELSPGAGNVERRVTVQSDFAVITATGTRFMVVKEANSPLEWLFGLDAGADDLTVQAINDPSRAAPTIKPVVSGVARWIAPVGVPSAGVDYDRAAVDAWLAGVEQGESVPEVGDILWPHAEARLDTDVMTGTLGPGMSMSMGGVGVSMERESALGRARTTPMDCNRDGIDDVLVENGVIRLDFRPLLNRVRGLDVTLMAGERRASGSVTVFDPAVEPIVRQSFEIAPGEGAVISLRSEEPYHYAEVAIAEGCFLGFSLTPPGPANARSKPVPAVDAWPPRPLAAAPTPTPSPQPTTPAPTPTPTTYAPSPTGVEIDGSGDDWVALNRQGRFGWIDFDTIVYDQRCSVRYPSADNDWRDLSARAIFAYDERHLFVAFLVQDDGFVGYTGSDHRYFLSDAPQLSLDLDLDGDLYDTRVNGDDKQIDFRVGIEEPGDSPAIAFWDLGPGRAVSRPLDAPVVAVATETGYFLEAAIPWDELGIEPADGLRLRVAVSVSDNDTPDTNVQECMISASPERAWDDPTTWSLFRIE